MNIQSRLSAFLQTAQWASRKEGETLLLMLEQDAKPTRDALLHLSGLRGDELSCERGEDGEERGDSALPYEMDLSTLGLGLCG